MLSAPVIYEIYVVGLSVKTRPADLQYKSRIAYRIFPDLVFTVLCVVAVIGVVKIAEVLPLNDIGVVID